MSLPRPEPGLVIRYSYLWWQEQRAGREEGTKDRPCAVVLTSEQRDEDILVVVIPITHAEPRDKTGATELPPRVKAHLGLDDERSWIVFSEANRFIWPGPDLRPLPGSAPPEFAYGFLPPKLFAVLKQRMIAKIRARHFKAANRTE
ncbi:hypothetical protein [Rhodobium gokarnense]|uniref:Growth inhibitor PemK n=1 Tax=Rhodobium gokarnense TaxID=364296 RepID=A0ABT3HEZ9_9HYPH|nr:hypothetical protein [Rhodobium gokarnense]MCW2308980.1 hypothetical protein [Rhodobium gokarnense]